MSSMGSNWSHPNPKYSANPRFFKIKKYSVSNCIFDNLLEFEEEYYDIPQEEVSIHYQFLSILFDNYLFVSLVSSDN